MARQGHGPGSRAGKPFGGGPHKGGPAYRNGGHPRPFGSTPRPARVRPATQVGSGGRPPKRGCCAMMAAGRAAGRGRFRLARRYAVMSGRLITARLGVLMIILWMLLTE